MHIMDLSREPSDRKYATLRGQVDKAEGYVFATFDSTIDQGKGPMTDVITRIWYMGKLIYHGSQFLVLDGKISPRGASAFLTDDDMIPMLGDWTSVKYWLRYSDEMAMFLADTYGEVLRGCRELEKQIGRGVYVDFFKRYDEQFAYAVAMVKSGTRS